METKNEEVKCLGEGDYCMGTQAQKLHLITKAKEFFGVIRERV